MSSPFFTGELKSANNSWMRPDTWLPTSTVTTACRLPDVLTRETTLPRSTVDGLVFGSRVATGQESIEKEEDDEDDRNQPDQASAGKLFEQVRIRSDVARFSRTSVDQSGAAAFP